MFVDLNNALNVQEGQSHLPFFGQFVVILDSLTADASFLLQHFLTNFLETNNNVCCVGLEQSLFHYFNIARKLGVNLQNEHSKGHFTYINGLAQTYNFLPETTTPTAPDSSTPFPVVPFSFQDGTVPLRTLYNKFKEIVEASQEHTCIIIDCINILAAVYSHNDILEFLQYCHVLVQSREKKGTLVVLLHGDDKQDVLVKSMKYKADLMFECTGLDSGVSRDIHGVVSISKKGYTSYQQYDRTLHYKVLENNVKFFPPGRGIH